MPPSARISVDAVISFDVVAFPVAWLALIIADLAICLGFCRERGRRSGGRCADAERTKEFTTPQRRLAFCSHRRVLLFFYAPSYAGSANASVSISIKRRPIAPTYR